MSRLLHQRGFTLLEVLISVGVLGLFGMILLDLQTSSVLQIHEAEKYEMATQLADENWNH